jgi:hypothetical protein
VTTTLTSVFRRLATAVALGAGAGALFLGVGGRLVMHAFAVATAGSGRFTLGGSLSVVLAGAIAGAIGGILLVVIERFLPERRWLRGTLFAAACYLIATHGFRPPQPLVFALFAPTFLAYGMALEWWWERIAPSHRLTSA